jgi:hypothetical protein
VLYRSAVRSLSLLLGLFLYGLLAALSPRTALAESTRVVLVLTEAESSAQPLDAHLLGALRGQLQELNVEVLVVRRPDEPLGDTARRARQIASAEHALGAIWLGAPASSLTVFLYDSTGHLYARSLPPDGSAVSQSEAIAIILRSAIAALLEGHAVGMTEVPVPPPASRPAEPATPPQPAPAPPADSRYLHAGLSYVGTLFARRTSWQNGAALTLAGAPTSWPLFFGVDYTFFPPVEFAANGVETRLQRHPIEALLGLRLRLGSVFFNVQGALSADYLTRSTTAASAGLVPTPETERWLWAISSRLGITVPVSPWISGVFNVGADFLLNPFEQVAQTTTGGDQLVAAPLLVRPRIELGAMISLW